ncbi:MAG: glycosyltransferase family 4 protein [Desulfovibrionaceae bacterium]
MGNPLRILHVAGSLGLGGTEKVMQLFVTHLDRSDFAPAVYSPEDGERAALIRQAGVEVHISPDMGKVLDRLRPDLVHVHRAGWPQPEMMRPLRAAGVPVVETNVFGRHDPSPSGRAVDRHLFVSHFCAERFGRDTGIPPQPPHYGVLYNPVDTDAFLAALPQGPKFSRPVVGRISRADPGKWSSLALTFLPHTLREVPEMEYRIIGGIPEARQWIDEQGLSDRVHFLPPVSTDQELAAFYGDCSVLAHANDTGESFGLVIAEAMACGLPVVTHPSMGNRDNAQLELVEHGVTGFVARDAEEFGRAVAYLLLHPDEARRMGRAGREKAVRLYRAQTVTKQLEAIYHELLQSKGTFCEH